MGKERSPNDQRSDALNPNNQEDIIRISIAGNIRNVQPVQIGGKETSKVIASIGVTKSRDSVKQELRKAQIAAEYGASIIIDHSLVKNALDIQSNIARNIDIPFSVIPVYNAAAMVRSSDKESYSAEDLLTIIEDQAKLGADMLTIHASVLKEDIEDIKRSKRLIPCTSRGGTMVLENMAATNDENYYWDHFDDVLAISKDYGLAISLGAIFRPASVADDMSNDILFWKEIERNGILVKMAQKAGVPIIVEGIGHASINIISEIIRRTKQICHDAPYRVLTVATDAALGFDHVSSAIASAVAVANGADVITAVTRSEHVGLPSVEEVKEAVISARIAAHCGDIVKLNDYDKDIAMSKARNKIGCKGLIDASVCPRMTRESLEEHKVTLSEKKCAMCGDFCALSAIDRIMGFENAKVNV